MNYKQGVILLALLLNIINASPMHPGFTTVGSTKPVARPAGKYFLVDTEENAKGNEKGKVFPI